MLVDLTCRDGAHRRLGGVDVWRIGIPVAAVEVDEHDERRPGGALVAVDFDVTSASSDDAIAAEAGRHPVFELTPVP
jgi:hypothetical protein